MNKKLDIEDLSDEDINNLDNVETVTYTPTIDDEELECNDEVYKILSYYDLDWPSQSVDLYKTDFLLVATNPENEPGQLKMFNMKNFEHEGFEYKSVQAPYLYNRIRSNTNINCVSDTTFDIYNDNLDKLISLSYDKVDYGLYSANETSIFAHDSGFLSIFNEQISDTFRIHSKSIESISRLGSLLFSASTDKTIKVTDIRSKDNIFNKLENAEINAVDTNKDNLFAYGDDNGTIKIVDIRMPSNVLDIFWHKSSISMIKWKDSDIFCSTSDEQLCIFDTSLEDDWEYEKYLLFVHQGQKYYKDVCFKEDLVITTSVEGLCFFKPISFAD